MVSDGETWCVADVRRRLIGRRAKLRALWDQLEQKHLERRRRNRQAIDELAAKKLEHAYIKRSDQLRLKPKSRENAARCAQYEGEIAMITAALASLSSPEAFAQAINKARAGTHLLLSREEVTSYRRGLERQFVALSAWLPRAHIPADCSRRVANTSKRPVGGRVRATAFEVSLQRSPPALEPEFQANTIGDAPERLRTEMLRRHILAVAERDLALCVAGQVREEAQLGVIVRANMLKVLHELSEAAIGCNDVQRAVLNIPGKFRLQISKNQDEATFQSLLNETFQKIKKGVDAAVAGKSPWVAIRATRPSLDRAHRRSVARAFRNVFVSNVGA